MVYRHLEDDYYKQVEPQVLFNGCAYVAYHLSESNRHQVSGGAFAACR